MLVAFDESYDPPMPVLPVHVSGVDADSPGVLLHAIVDTGADCSVLPERTVRTLRLPVVDIVSVQGFAGESRARPIYAARLRIGGKTLLARIIGFGSEALLGRDVLNRLVMRFNGPERQLELVPPKRRGSRR